MAEGAPVGVPEGSAGVLAVLGAARLATAQGAIALRPKERAVLAAIGFEHPQVVSWQRIADLVWGSAAPVSARGSIHNHVNRIRQKAPGVVTTVPDGYRLGRGVHTDLELLACSPDGRLAADPLDLLERARSAFADLEDSDVVIARRHEVRRIVRAALLDACDRSMRDGRRDDATTITERLVADDPFDERAWHALVLAHARAGRRRDALAAIATARREFAQAGLALGPDVHALEAAVLDGTVDLEHPGATDARPHERSPVGIESSLRRLDEICADRRGAAALVVGPAGSGKSTLLHTFAARASADGWRVLAVHCHRDPLVPLQPIVELVERLVDARPRLLDELADPGALGALSDTLASRLGPIGVVDRPRLLTAISQLFGALPDWTLVTVEDVHWAPPRTVDALRVLADAVSGCGRRVVAVLTERVESGDEPRPLAGLVVPTRPWAARETREWLAEFEPDASRLGAAVEWLVRQSGGSPMFVRELTFDLLRAGAIGPSATGAFQPPSVVPAAIANALTTRVAQLSVRARRTMDAAAVLPGDIDRAHLRRMVGDGDGAAAIAELEQRGMLVPAGDGRLAFAHDLLRRVVRERLSPAAHAELHDVALAALDQGATAMERAHHALGAAELDTHRAVELARAAGVEALDRWARIEAAEWWLAGAALLAPDRADAEAWCRLRIEAGQQLLHAGDDRAEEVLLDAAHLAERRGMLDLAVQAAIAISRLGPTSEAGAAHDEAAALCARLLARLDEPGRRAALAAAATTVHSLNGEAARCRLLIKQAIADAEIAQRDDVWADVLPYCYQSLGGPDDLDRREELTTRLHEVGSRLQRPDTLWSALHLRFANQVQRGDPAARQTGEALAELAGHVREQSRDWEMHYVRATLRQLDGDLDGAEAEITRSLSFGATIAQSRVLAVYGVQLLSIRLQQRRLAELVDSVAALAAAQSRVGAWQAALAVAAAHSGDAQTARASFDLATARGAALLDRDQTYTAALLALGEAAIELEDPDRAAAVGALLEPYSTRWSWAGSCTLGPIDTTLAGLAFLGGRDDEGRTLAQRAERAAQALGAPRFAEAAAARRRGDEHP